MRSAITLVNLLVQNRMQLNKAKRKLLLITFAVSTFFVTHFATAEEPELEVVQDFDLSRYTGLWYELARLENFFERDLVAVTAEYQKNEDGTIRVINRGYHPKKQKWKQSTASARKIGDPNEGLLKVTFFWPFSSGYYILDLDTENYDWALVTGDKRDYLWILSRKTSLPQETLDRLLQKAESLGFPTDELVWVDQTLNSPQTPNQSNLDN